MTLQNYHEIVGNLTKVEQKNDRLELTFAIEKTVEIPDTTDIKKLKDLIGDRVGVLNCDGDFKIRKITESGTGGGKTAKG